MDEIDMRAYMDISTLGGMRGEILKFFLDGALKLYEKDEIEDDKNFDDDG